MASSDVHDQLHKVFVYGTLKRGEPNHGYFSKDNNSGYSKFLYKAKTEDKLPLIIATQYNVPFILYSPGNGTNIIGEVYEVDDSMLKSLDELEEHPDFYERQLFSVQAMDGSKEIVLAWIYVIKKFRQELLSRQFLESYSSSGSHGLKYIERYLRSGNFNHRTEVSEHFQLK